MRVTWWRLVGFEPNKVENSPRLGVFIEHVYCFQFEG